MKSIEVRSPVYIYFLSDYPLENYLFYLGKYF
jgi:hypothetical protein